MRAKFMFLLMLPLFEPKSNKKWERKEDARTMIEAEKKRLDKRPNSLVFWFHNPGPNSCFYCGQSLSRKTKDRRHRATVDHYVPVCLGGNDSLANMVAACKLCNEDKDRQHGDNYVRLLAAEW